MNMEFFIGILLITSIATGLLTEAMKKALNESGKKYSSNLLAGCMSAASSVIVAIGYIIFANISVDARLIYEIILLFVASWVVSMVGFDKVKQSLLQIAEVKDK